MGKIQNQTGKAFEDELMELFTAHGYWCKKMNGRGGTVFDVIAVKPCDTVAIEAKTVSKGEVLRYTKELRKKTDELSHYDSITGNLFIAVRFGHEVMFCPWWMAFEKFQAYGFLIKENCQQYDYFF